MVTIGDKRQIFMARRHALKCALAHQCQHNKGKGFFTTQEIVHIMNVSKQKLRLRIYERKYQIKLITLAFK